MSQRKTFWKCWNKVVGYDKNTYYKLFLDVHDHMGEVQSFRHPGVGHWSQGVPSNYFLAIPWDTPGSMPYSWMSEALDNTQMVMDIWKQLNQLVSSYQTSFVSTTLPKSNSLGHPRVNDLHMGVWGSGLHPDGHGRPKTTWNNYFHHT